MFAMKQHRRNAAGLLASAAILLAGCGPAASPQWTYTPLTVDTSTAPPSAAASASTAPASLPADTASPAASASSPADTASPAPSPAQ